MGWLDWLFRRRTSHDDGVPATTRSNADAEVGWTVTEGGWLRRPITVEEAERRNPGLEADPRAESHPHIVRPFGFQSAQWEALKAQIQPGDELFEFSSPSDHWAHLTGRAGIELVRDDKTIAEIVTLMN